MRFIDLTQTISSTMQVYPGTEPPILNVPCTVDEHGFKETEITFYSHTGTHMDSPAHIFSDGKPLDDFSVDSFYGTGIVVDCTDINYGGEITEDHIKYLGSDVEEFDFVLFYTGWDNKWESDDYFRGFPTISSGLADRLCKLNIKGIGIDAISVEPITAKKLEIHHKILGEEKIIIENLKNLKLLIEEEFSICAFPLKFEDADGSPIRAVALITDRSL
jgi:kynurenine formamidase